MCGSRRQPDVIEKITLETSLDQVQTYLLVLRTCVPRLVTSKTLTEVASMANPWGKGKRNGSDFIFIDPSIWNMCC